MRKLLFKVIRYSGLPFLFREIIQKKRVTILLFHDINEKTAKQAFSYLSKQYNIISLEEFVRFCKKQNNGSLPAKGLIITFDDGFTGNYELLPLVKEHNIPITIFLCAGIINTKRHYWFSYKHPDISASKLKQVSNVERLKLLNRAGFHPQKEFSTPQALTKTQISEMEEVVNFQAHTTFHPCLPTCNDEEARAEIIGAKEILERDFNININAIAYPNGDYSDRDIELCKEAGYQCGLTVDYGFNTIHTDPFKLKRLSVNDTDNLDELIVKASGVWAFLKTRNGKKQAYGWAEVLQMEN